MMRRRHCIALATSGLLAPLQRAGAQSAERVYRVGVLRDTARPAPGRPLAGTFLPKALGELGYVEGRNLILELRWADGDFARLPALAQELVAAGVDVIIAIGGLAVRACKAATTTLPIILFGNFDPVALGLVASLARPGANVTGVVFAPDGTLAGKQLELLKAAVPRATRVAFLSAVADNPANSPQAREVRAAAAVLGLELAVVGLRGGDYAQAFVAIMAQRPHALFVGASPRFLFDGRQIIELAAKHRLPAIYEWREHVVNGGLMTYSASQYGQFQRLASFVDRVLKGAKPGDMPIERPTRFELVINLKTAKALGLSLPQALLARADEVIE
jgi:putative tryptophan/tyrosine transport system substrate-binding protein